MLAEIQERNTAVKDLDQSLLVLHQIFLDMAVLVEAQVRERETHWWGGGWPRETENPTKDGGPPGPALGTLSPQVC